jgi:type II secretory pathway component PulK
MTGRRGFALLAVLWVIVALTALAGRAVEHARADAATSGDLVAHTRGRWAAEGCLAVALSRIEGGLRAGRQMAVAPPDSLAFANGAHCGIALVDPNGRLLRDSLTPAEGARLDSLMRASGFRGSREELLTPYGDGHVNLNAAPPVVLAMLPGIGAEALRTIVEDRAWHRPVRGLNDLAARLSPAGRAQLNARYSELAGIAAFETSTLVVDATAWLPGSRAVARIEVLVVNGGGRAAIARRRTW